MPDKKYTIIVRGSRVPVSMKVYKAHHQEQEHIRYLKKGIKKNELSLERFEEGGLYPHVRKTPHITEDMYIQQELLELLSDAIASLNADEQRLLSDIFYENKSERQIAETIGITQKGVNKRKSRLLEKLRKILDN